MSGQPGLQSSRQEIKRTSPWQIVFDFLLLLAAFPLARGSLLGEIFPFGTAILITVIFRRRRLVWPMVAVVMASSYLAASAPDYSRLSLFLFLGLTAMFYPSLKGYSTLTQATLAPLATILVRGVGLAVLQPSFYGWVLIIFEAVLSWGLAIIFLEATVASRQEERLLGGGLFLLGILLGVQGWQLMELSLQSLISRYVILLGAFAGGAGAGAAVGALAGFLPSISQLSSPALAGLLAVGGLVAGSFKNLGKPGVICGFILAHLLLANYFLGPDSIMIVLKESGLAALVLLLTPGYIVSHLREYLFRPAIWPQVRTDKQEWQKLQQALISLSRALKFHDFSDYSWEAIHQVARTTCRGCPAIKVCWEMESEQMLSQLQKLLKQSHRTSLNSADIPEWLSSRCSRSRELLAALTIEAEKMEIPPTDKQLNNWLINIFEALAKIIVQERGEAKTKGDPPEGPLWQVTVGIAAVPRYQSDIIGDAYLAAALEIDKQVLMLGDGMGVGREAADISSTAIELVRNLLDAGFTAELALQTVNTILLLRTGKEIYTTLDLAIIDSSLRTVEFYKLGACPSFIRQGGKVKVLGRCSLPVGILEDFQVQPLQEKIKEGDLLLMVSDGVLEAHRDINEKEKWVAKALQRAGDARPQEIAERLLKQARALTNNQPRDDMTIMVARVEKKDEV